MDYRLTRLTIDITGRENGSDVDSGIIILFKKDRTFPSLTQEFDPSHIMFFMAYMFMNGWIQRNRLLSTLTSHAL